MLGHTIAINVSTPVTSTQVHESKNAISNGQFAVYNIE